MYHASDFDHYHERTEYTQQTQNNDCMLSTTSHDLKIGSLRSFYHVHLQCLTACSLRMSLECPYGYTSRKFLSGAVISVTVLPSLRSAVPQAFGAFGAPKFHGPLYMTSYLMFTCRPLSFEYFDASNFPSSSSMNSALITGSSLYNSNYGQSVLNSANRASYTVESEQSPDEHQHHTSRCDKC